MIRDRDRIYSAVVRRRLRAMGIRDKPIAPASPWQNGIVERLIGSIRRESVDHMIVLGEAHLRRILKSYARYYNETRTHLALDKDAPVSRPVERNGVVRSRAILGGLHHHYATTAAPHGDAARLLPVLRLAPLRPQAQLDPPRSPATLGARPATPRSTTADQLGVSEQSTGVRAAVSSHIASSGMKRRSSQKSSGEPSAGNLHAGFCLGRRVQEATLAR